MRKYLLGLTFEVASREESKDSNWRLLHGVCDACLYKDNNSISSLPTFPFSSSKRQRIVCVVDSEILRTRRRQSLQLTKHLGAVLDWESERA